MTAENQTEYTFDRNGFRYDGDTGLYLHRNGTRWDDNGFDRYGWHRHTGTPFHPETHLTREGSEYDSAGYNHAGRDSEGYDSEGYDEDGNSRCENGDCTDEYCERCNPSDSFSDRLDSYGCNVIRACGWTDKSTFGKPDRTLYAGHEFEMFSDHEDFDDVEFVLRQIDTEYRKHNPQTRTGRCTIAKSDGSLSEYNDYGFETVTVPLNREQTYGIFKSFDVLGSGRCSAWTLGTGIGHHIHLSRQAIGPLTLGKMLVFMNAEPNRDFLSAIAGRAPNDYADFSRKKLTSKESMDRYEVLNVTGCTAEFRLFRSNLYTRAILKNYEFAVSVVRFCETVSHGFGDVYYSTDPLHFHQYRRWLAHHHAEYPFLHAFLLGHSALKVGYKSTRSLPRNAVTKEQSPKFAMVRLASVGA